MARAVNAHAIKVGWTLDLGPGDEWRVERVSEPYYDGAMELVDIEVSREGENDKVLELPASARVPVYQETGFIRRGRL